MTKFLEQIATALLKMPDLYQKTVVLPNKRSGIFLKKALVETAKQPILAPQIVSIETFLSDLSSYQSTDWLVLLFNFYETYKQVYGKEAQSFDEFVRWAPTVLQDFNEIDAFDVDAKEVFTYINEVKKIEDWQLKPDSPKMITDYLKFYAGLYDLYQNLNRRLQKQSLAYQGMISRYVSDHIETIAEQFEPNQIIFAGFNALTKTEKNSIKYLVEAQKAQIFWDADRYYLKPHFEAGKFINRHRKDFKDFKWVFDDFSKPKTIDIIGVIGKTTQAQAIAEILNQSLNNTENPNQILQDTAVVLNEDDLLLPVINALPDAIEHVNITLGLPLKNLGLIHFFELLVHLYAEKEQYGRFNLETIFDLTNQNYLEQILSNQERISLQSLRQKLSRFKSKLITQQLWLQTLKASDSFIKKLIINDFNVKKLLDLFLELLNFLSDQSLSEMDKLALIKMEKLTLYLQDFVQKTGEINHMRSFQFLFNRLLQQERLAFEGEPLMGLQVMGILETRLLDYKHVIITSMNEGIIPKGRNDKSIIPFELKKHFGLPMHHQHNAVIAYHFYRLLQRAEHISLLYNLDDNSFGTAEQSRFITQIENELDRQKHQIKRHIFDLSTELNPDEKEIIPKTAFTLDRLNQIAQNGFSPSAFGTYIRNPLIYYKKYILQLQENQEITDAISTNIIGTIIHDVMEILYKPFIGKTLKIANFESFFKHYESLSLRSFITESFGKEIPADLKMITGKNLIVFEIIKKHIKDLLVLDQKLVKSGHQLEIVALEKKLKAKLPVEQNIFIRGTVDRIDRLDGRLRIIDYKTGHVEPKNISTPKKAQDLDALRTEVQTEKLFQLLTYAWLYYKNGKLRTSDLPLEVGILSTRHIRNGLLKAQVYNQSEIDLNVIKEFENQLIALTAELFNPDIPFIETESPY